MGDLIAYCAEHRLMNVYFISSMPHKIDALNSILGVLHKTESSLDDLPIGDDQTREFSMRYSSFPVRGNPLVKTGPQKNKGVVNAVRSPRVDIDEQT